MVKKNVILFLINIVLVILISGVLYFHWSSMAKERNEIDQLKKSLDEIIKIVPETTPLSLYSNIPHSANDSDLFRNLVYKCQFILAPRTIVRESDDDTILYIDFKKKKNIEFQLLTDTITIISGYSFDVYLLLNKAQ